MTLDGERTNSKNGKHDGVISKIGGTIARKGRASGGRKTLLP